MDRTGLKLLIALIGFGATMYGLYRYLKVEEENFCKMTYMFEYPEYIKIPLTENARKQFPKYNLYIYGEGMYAKELRSKNYSGIPVLFIYGNAGSFRQGRSISSIAYRIGLSKRSPFLFNVYFADFREEYSGLYGGVLEDQTAFVIECIRTILSLYPSKKQVILIGHSMGGVIARAVFSHEKFISGSISLIYTLATPHEEPVIPFDKSFVTFYNQISEIWKNGKGSDIADVPLVSIGGGTRDIIVRSSLTAFKFEKDNGYHILTPSMPGVWLSVDHLAIVWCKQLVITLSRSMYDLVDVNINEITTNKTLIREVLFHHFIERSQDGHFVRIPVIPFHLFSSGQWIEQIITPWRFSRSKIFSTIYILLPLKKDEDILVIASGLVKYEWIFACSSQVLVQNKSCSEGKNLSHLGKIIPPKTTAERRMISLKSSELIDDGFTHVVLYISASNSRVDILGESYSLLKREQKVILPSYFERATTFSPMRVKTFPLSENRVFHKLVFSGLSDLIDSSNFFLERRVCKTGSIIGQGLVKLTFVLSQDHHYHTHYPESSFHHIKTTLGGITTIPIKPETLPRQSDNASIIMELFLDPECGYELSLSLSFSNVLSQFIKFYGLFIPGYTVAIYLSILGYLLKSSAKGYCPSLKKTLKFPTFTNLVIVPTAVHYGMRFCYITPGVLPEPDNIFVDYRLHSMLMHRSILYIIAFGIVAVLNFIFENCIVGSSMIWIFVKKRTIFQVTEKSLSDTPTAYLQASKYKIAFGAFLIFMSLVVAGSVALILGFMFLLGKVLVMCIKCKAEEQRRGPSIITAKWHFVALLTLLWMLAASLTIPAFLTWFHEITFSFGLVSDPHACSSAVMVLSATVLSHLPIPVLSQSYYKYASHVIQFFAILSALYGIKSVYRQVYFVSSAFIVLGIQQLLSYELENRLRKID